MVKAFFLLLALWWAGELAMALFRRAGRGESTGRDRGSMPVFFVTNPLAVTAGFVLGSSGVWPLGLAPGVRLAAALALLVLGLGLRVWAILVLGPLFTMNVAIRPEHRLVVRGPYRWLRHPSYTGMLLAFASIGVAYGSGASVAAVLLPILLATLYRIRVEERALSERFGEEYRRYSARTYRLLPLVY